MTNATSYTQKIISIDAIKTIFVSAHSWRLGAPDSTGGESWPLELVHSKVRSPERREQILALAAECREADAPAEAAERARDMELEREHNEHLAGHRRVINAGQGRCK